jgi:hypothetical protein
MKYFFPFFICALFASCFNEGDCLVTATNYMRVQFKKKKNSSEDTVVTFYSIVMRGQDTLPAFYSNSQILLPLNLSQDSSATTFIIHRINSDTSKNAIDTLTISYTKQTKIISKDCGAYTFYQILKVDYLTSHHDSVTYKIPGTSLLKNPTGASTDVTSYAVNLQIFLKP